MKWLAKSFRPVMGTGRVEERRRIDFGAEDPPYAIYAIPDIHGCLDLLKAAEDAILDDVKRGQTAGLIILLGDYVDRGPDSCGVLEHLGEPIDGPVKRVALCGNHDDLFLRFFEAPDAHASWLDMGGRETLASYGIANVYPSTKGKGWVEQVRAQMDRRVPAHHIALLKSLPVSLRIGRFFFAHAGIRPGVALEKQSEADLMWIREPFLTKGPLLPFTVIHGHTPFRKPSLGAGRIGIDTGAYVSGKLSIVKLQSGQVSFIQ